MSDLFFFLFLPLVLSQLNLAWNKLQLHGGILIAEGISLNNTMKHIDLRPVRNRPSPSPKVYTRCNNNGITLQLLGLNLIPTLEAPADCPSERATWSG